jgi:HD-GYP domain-containing protein (c-di-GMP phosphodiesterase class II)
MESVKNFVLRHFERLVVIVILGVVGAAHFLFARGTPVLFFYFLPALTAGYVLGKRNALMTAILSILAVTFFFVIEPDAFVWQYDTSAKLIMWMDLAAWGGFLILAALVTGQLYEEKERRIEELRAAYIGILDVLSRYLESPGDPIKGHCHRVADLSAEIARAMGLPRSMSDNVHAAALLHDIEMTGAGSSGEAIHRAAMLSEDEDQLKDQSGKNAEILQSVGMVLKEAVPLIRSHREQMETGPDGRPDLIGIPLGARIVAVADAYDNLVHNRQTHIGRAPWVAVKEIEKGAGTRFDPEVIDGLKAVVARQLEENTVALANAR